MGMLPNFFSILKYNQIIIYSCQICLLLSVFTLLHIDKARGPHHNGRCEHKFPLVEAAPGLPEVGYV